MYHDDLSTWAPGDIEADLVATQAAIRSAAPGADIPYFRAPYGRWGYSASVAHRLGMRPLGWRIDVMDWEPPGTDVLVARLRSRIAPGAIILLHDGGGDRSQTVDAVDRIVPDLHSDGWTFVLPGPQPAAPRSDSERDVQV
jgi:peptidoglycan/xylan/chitin deacetylase (PgdA/CDA1 family)